MAVKLETLYESVKNKEITLVAGKNGLSNVVRWVHMVENAEISSFLDGKEVTFTTGIGLQNESDLLDLVKLNYENGASGMVINIGPFIKKISPEIKSFCDEHNFPLFEVPWHVHMAEIMRIFCFMITESEKISMELTSAIKNAIFFPHQEDLYIPQLEQRGFKVDWSYCVSIIDLLNKNDDIKKQRSRILKQIENNCVRNFTNTIIFEHEEKIIIIFSNYSEKEIKEIVSKIKTKYISPIKNLDSIIAIGQCSKNIKYIYKSYRQAQNVSKLLSYKNSIGDICTYRELGLYKLLLSIEDTTILKEYYSETLDKLYKYDELNNTDYIEVLRIYLENNGGVKDTAETLFVHRNTINYKIHKIEEILNCNLSDLNTRLSYRIAFMIKEIL